MFFLALATLASAAPPKRVLILDSFGRDVAPFNIGAAAFRTTLAREAGQPVDIHEASLDMARFADPGFEKALVDFLEQRFAGAPMDLVVPVGAPAAAFAAQHRERLFAETPIVFMGADPRRMPPEALKSNATLVTEKADLPGVIEDMLQLRPDTTNIVVVFGVSPMEKFWAGEFRREWQAFTNRLGFSWLDTLSLQQMQERVQKLPPHSFIVVPMLLMDANHVPYDGYEGFEAIHAAANAPVFGCYMSQIGGGAIGGRLYQDSKVGTLAARVAIRILHGEAAAAIPPQIIGPSQPTYDWRELTRWHVSPDRLPAGSVIEFRDPTFWEQHRWRIVGVVVFCCLQTGLIIGLVVNRAKRREENTMATLIAELSSRFIDLPADKVDPEIQAAQRRICECLGLDISMLWQGSADRPEELLLTHIYRRVDGPPIPGRMSVRDYFPWCWQEVKAKRRFTLASLAEAAAGAERDLEVLRHFGIKAVLTIPLAAGEGPALGAASFATVWTERAWPEDVVERLQVVAQIFANALARKRSSEALRQSEERFRQVAEIAGEFIWEVDANGLYTYASPLVERILGYSPEELVGKKHFYDLFDPSVREELKAAAFRVFADRQTFREFPNPNLSKTGRIVHLETSGIPIVDATGKLVGYRGADTDVTARRQAEAEAQRSRLELAHVSRVSTLGELAASLAHELSQPLGAILRNTEAAELMLDMTPPDLEELLAIITDIRNDDLRAAQVIDRLRSLFKRRSLALQPVELDPLIGEVLLLVQADATARRVMLRHLVAPGLARVRGDRVHLQQVLLNLLLNAMDALGGVAAHQRSIQIVTQRHGTRGVEVRVSDNGPGIPGECLERLFEPFYSTKPNGMGMGLPVSKTIIEAHQGTIWAENRPEGGACFCFTLPVADG